jgi:hypothetical protein
MARCSWSTDQSMSFIVRIFREIISRFTFRSSLYDSPLVLLCFLKVTRSDVTFLKTYVSVVRKRRLARYMSITY